MMDDGAIGLMMLCGLSFMGLVGYFIPLIVAYNRHHKDVVAIGALNLFLGWSFLGWIVALIWALKN